jgi:lipopolysaccharide assembly protein A
LRYVYLAMIVLVTVVVAGFTAQNMGPITVAWLSWSITLPLSVLTIVVYVLGMLTGGALLSAVRAWVSGATKPVTASRPEKASLEP